MGQPPSEALRRIGRAGPNAWEMELLRAATLDTDRAAAAWRQWSATHVVDDASHRAVDLLPAVHAHLPPSVLGAEAGRLRGLRRRIWAETQFRHAVLAGAVAVLAPLGIRPLVTKGAALSTTVYREPGIRPMSDVDIVVGPERFGEVMDAFASAGWHRPATIDNPFDHAVGLYDPQHRAIDVHRWVLFPRFAPAPETDWIERMVPHQVQGHQLSRFRCADEMVLTILHGLLVSGASSVRWPLDVVNAARSGPAVDGIDPDRFWDDVVESASAIGTGPIVADALEMCRVELDAPVPVSAVERLGDAALDRHIARHWALCRRGITIEWRYHRYRTLQQLHGRRATVRGYLGPRYAAMRAKGLRSAASDRAERVRRIIADKRRD